MIKNNIYKIARNYLNYSIKLRRDFHQHPELGFQEFRTSKIISKKLENLGFDVKENIGKTGILGLLTGSQPGPTVLLRFDMDALPILEENSIDYISNSLGIMHACGHDGHMAVGLTLAKIISDHKNKIKGSIKFIFQPAEEGLGGALAVIQDGVLENPRPDYSLGLHIWNEQPLGWIGVNPGPMMAGADIFDLTIHGKGGHGGLPNNTIDPIVAAAQIINAAQSIISRNISPLEKGVISFGSVNGGSTFNVIPDKVRLSGTIRTFNSQTRIKIIERLESISHLIGEAMGCKIEFSINEITPAVINDPNIASALIDIVEKRFPTINIDPTFKSMASEDYSFFLNEVPGCFFFVGSANPDKGLTYGHHHPRFNFDEDVLSIAVSILMSMIERFGNISFD